MRTTRQDLETALAAAESRATAYAICMTDLLHDRGTWIRRGRGSTAVAWFVVRPTGPSGGYVIRTLTDGILGDCLLLDTAIKAAHERASYAAHYTGYERTQVDHEASIAAEAAQLRAKAIAETLQHA